MLKFIQRKKNTEQDQLSLVAVGNNCLYFELIFATREGCGISSRTGTSRLFSCFNKQGDHS